MKISFVVPTRNAERSLDNCLASLRAQRHHDVEVVVVDNASQDRTKEIATRFADRVLDQGPERSAQRNRGTAESTGDVVVFIDADMVLEPRIAEEVEEAFARDPRVGALVIPERSFGEGFFASCRELEKTLYVGDEDVEAPRAFRRAVIEGIGGWSEELTAAEDWDLADRVRVAGVATGRTDSFIWHDEGRIALRGTFRKKRYYGRWIARYLAAHPREGRRKLVRTALLRHGRTLAAHPVRTAGMVLLKLVEAAGLLSGARDARRVDGVA